MCFFLLPISLSPTSLGNISNPYDNIMNFQDRAFFNFTITVPLNSVGNLFSVSALLTFNNTITTTTMEALTQDYFVVLPNITIETDISSK